jgi:hypothetical protein
VKVRIFCKVLLYLLVTVPFQAYSNGEVLYTLSQPNIYNLSTESLENSSVDNLVMNDLYLILKYQKSLSPNLPELTQPPILEYVIESFEKFYTSKHDYSRSIIIKKIKNNIIKKTNQYYESDYEKHHLTKGGNLQLLDITFSLSEWKMGTNSMVLNPLYSDNIHWLKNAN